MGRVMEPFIYGSSLVIIAVTCLLAVFVRKFDDNLVQRIGLSIACLGACLRMAELFEYLPDDTKARYLFTYGIAVFCMGAVWKIWRKP